MNFGQLWLGHTGAWFTFFMVFGFVNMLIKGKGKIEIFPVAIISTICGVFSATGHLFLFKTLH